MAKNNNLTDFLTGIADKIREVENSSDPINPQDFEDKIEEVSQKYIPVGEYVLVPNQNVISFNTDIIHIGGGASTYLSNGQYVDDVDELYYTTDGEIPYLELFTDNGDKIFEDSCWQGFDNNIFGGYLFVHDPIPVTAAQLEDFNILTGGHLGIGVADYIVATQSEEVMHGVEFAVNGNILMGAMPMAQIGTPNVGRDENIISFGATVSQSGYIDAGTPVGVGSYTMPTVVRGATTISVANGGSNAIAISAANTQATGYVTGSTASSSMKVYVTRTDNKVYLRPGSTSATAVASIVVPTIFHPSPTITLNTTTGVITAQHTQATGYVTGHTATATLTIKLAEDNKF